MIILAVYYTLADIVLLAQCFYYRGFTLRDDAPSASHAAAIDEEDTETDSVPDSRKPSEQTSLLSSQTNGQSYQTNGHSSPSLQPHLQQRRHSATSFRDILHSNIDGTHLSPATPFIDTPSPKETRAARSISTLQTVLFNACAIALVCAAGVLGWYVSPGSSKHTEDGPSEPSLSFDLLGQVFGYFCAVLYLGSRLPQILLNYRRKSTEGVSLLFFLFACIGNLTYVLSILAYSPICKDGRCRPGEAGAIYGRYILVNLSWLIGSFGTLFLDMCIFAQFFMYQDNIYVDESASQETVRG